MVRKALHTLLVVMLALVAMVESVGWAAIIADNSGSGDRDGVVLVGSMIGLLGGSVLHVVVHELGHLLAARTMRLKVLGMRIWKLQWGAPGSLAGSSGHVQVDLRRWHRALPARLVVFVAAGPLANVAAAVLTAVVATNESVPLEVRVVAVGLTAAGLCTAILNLVPYRLSGTTASDGLALLRWIFRPGKEVALVRRRDVRSSLRPIAPRN